MVRTEDKETRPSEKRPGRGPAGPNSPGQGDLRHQPEANEQDIASQSPGATANPDMDAWNHLLAEDLDSVEDRLQQALGSSRLRAEIQAAARHLVDAGGKRFRPMLVLLAAGAADSTIPKPHLHALAAAAELIHSASLLHDDVVDEGEMRRGKPASRILWGNAVSVLAGDYCLASSLSQVSSIGRFEVIESLNETVTAMVNAEALQLSQRGSLEVDRDRYFEIIQGKTATLMAWCASAGGLIPGETGRTLWDVGMKIGMAFQIWDDLLDYEADAASLGKSLVQDLSEGKLTLPFIEACREDDSLPAMLLDALAATPDGRLTEANVSALTDRVRATSALETTRAQAQHISRQASALVETLPGPASHRNALAALALFTTRRRR